MHSVSVRFVDCPCHRYVQVFSDNIFIYVTKVSGVVCSLDLSLARGQAL